MINPFFKALCETMVNRKTIALVPGPLDTVCRDDIDYRYEVARGAAEVHGQAHFFHPGHGARDTRD